MPTWYTAAIEDGISFEQFALNCARAFGALVTMRNEPLNAETPREFEPSGYHAGELSEAMEKFSALKRMSLEEAEAMALEEYNSESARHAENIQRINSLKQAYISMLKQVDLWAPPTPEHFELKRFMRDQISESIKFDCSWHPEKPTLKSGKEWLENKLLKIEDKICYHKDQHEEELARTKERNDWLKELRDSLAKEQP